MRVDRQSLQFYSVYAFLACHHPPFDTRQNLNRSVNFDTCHIVVPFTRISLLAHLLLPSRVAERVANDVTLLTILIFHPRGRTTNHHVSDTLTEPVNIKIPINDEPNPLMTPSELFLCPHRFLHLCSTKRQRRIVV